MSGHDRYDSRRRGGSAWTTWVPLAVTVTAAAVGFAAWMLLRSDEDAEEEEQQQLQHQQQLQQQQEQQQQQQQPQYGEAGGAHGAPQLISDLDYEHGEYGDNPAYGSSRSRAFYPGGSRGGDAAVQPAGAAVNAAAESGEWGLRVTRALGRASSPGAMLDRAGRKVAAGVAAAGAAVGGALAAIRDDDKPAESGSGSGADEAAWSDSAVAPPPKKSEQQQQEQEQPRARGPSRRRKTVAVVISADGHGFSRDGGDVAFLEHASILSHIPSQTDFSTARLFILIYAPGLKDSAVPGGSMGSNLGPRSLSSSYSNIGHEMQLETPSETPESGFTDSSPFAAYNAVREQALALVEDKVMVLPFTTPGGYVYMLRHLDSEVDVIYLQESLSGEHGLLVSQMQSWFRHDIILVVGAEEGHGGGLADSDSEDEGVKGSDREGDGALVKWWQKPERVGRGRGVIVVDSMRVTDDWAKRVQGME